MTPDIPKYDYLDALRGLAILGVLLVHASNAVAPDSSLLQRLMAGVAYGVQLFYVVSALTLCMSWDVRSAHEISPVHNFFIRRFFRIAPLFYLAIVFYVSLYGFSSRSSAPHGIDWWFIPLTFLFLHGFHPETITSVVPGGWSVAVEITYYLVLPFLLHRLASTKSYVVFMAACFAVYALSAVAFKHLWFGSYPAHQQYLVSSFTYLNFFGQLPVFAVGMLAYRALKNRNTSARWAIFGGIVVPFLILMALFQPTHRIAHVLPSHILMGCMFASLAPILARFPIWLLVNMITTHLGKISFSMYLTHFAVIELYVRLGIVDIFPIGDVSSILFYLWVVATTAPLSYLTYLFVERQGVLLGNRLIDRIEQDSPPGDASHATQSLTSHR